MKRGAERFTRNKELQLYMQRACKGLYRSCPPEKGFAPSGTKAMNGLAGLGMGNLWRAYTLNSFSDRYCLFEWN
jgi:hypothetical protein